jgi:hypothetical protein
MADVEEVEFEVRNERGRFIEKLSNSEYRKKKRQLKKNDCQVKSVRMTHSFGELASMQDGKVKEFDPAAEEFETDFDTEELR